MVCVCGGGEEVLWILLHDDDFLTLTGADWNQLNSTIPTPLPLPTLGSRSKLREEKEKERRIGRKQVNLKIGTQGEGQQLKYKHSALGGNEDIFKARIKPEASIILGEEVKDTVTMAAASVSEEPTSGEPGRSKSDHESVCAVPCEFYISLILICWKWSCQGHVEIKCCSMVLNIEEE